MALILDPERNPLLRLYTLREAAGVEVEDGRGFLVIRDLEPARLGLPESRQLLGFLHRRARVCLDVCAVAVEGRQVMNVARESVADWLDGQAVADLEAQGRLGESSLASLASLRESVESDYWPPGVDPVEEALALLDDLAADGATLEIRLDKAASVERYLLPEPLAAGQAVSATAWYDLASFTRAFDGFAAFRDWAETAGERPLLFFFYRPVPVYRGDFCRVLPLRGGDGEPESHRQRVEEALAGLAAEVPDRYRERLLRRWHEPRPRAGRFDLPPALLLERPEAGYPEHPLFQHGPLRSLLLYALMAWLAREVRAGDGETTFPLAAGEGGEMELVLRFTLEDVLLGGESLFAPEAGVGEAPALLSSLAGEVERCTGREPLRRLWHQACAERWPRRLDATGFWTALAVVQERFQELERSSPVVPQDPPDLELRIFAQGGETRFELHGSVRDQSYFHQSMGSAPLPPEATGRRDQLSEMADAVLERLLDPGRPSQPAWMPQPDDLASWGRELWQTEIPEGLRRAYGELRGEPDLTLLIVSTDPSYPWELAKPYRGLEMDDDFWAFKFRLARWLAGHRPPASKIGCKRVLCVSTTLRLQATAEERAYFEELAPELDELRLPNTKGELLDALRQAQFDLIHFACHGDFAERHPRDSVIQLPSRELLRVRDLYDGAIEANVGESRPLIFLNACHSGRVGPTMTHLGGWAERLIAMGCGAFLGCGWEVADPLAARFALTFYDALLGREAAGRRRTLGEAVQAARRAIRSDHNSTWLAYYLYGNPNCRVK